jgi:Ca2+-binding RTX toxin-like protein
MEVIHQVNDTIETRFDNLIRLEVLQTPEGVFVLAGGTDNGLTLMLLDASGRLLHLASMGDELREMALLDTGGTEMIWRDGGLDIFVTGEVLEGDNDAGRGLTHLRVADLEGNLPQIQTGNADHLLTGTAGQDVFMVADTNIAQVIRGYDKAADQLDLSQMGRFHDISEVEVSRTSTGAVFRLGEAQVTVFTDDGSPLHTRDLTTEDMRDLWHIDIAPPAPAVGVPQAFWGGAGPDLLDGRAGADVLLGQPRDAAFDDCSAQIYRLYQATLGREPDLRGLMNWSARLEDGTLNLLEVVSGFTGSVEFTETYGNTSNRDFVTLLYDNVLGRAPDATGLANWSGRIDDGVMSRAQVVQGFSESAEFITGTAAPALAFSRAGLQAEFADDVYRMYRATLDRDPDLDGFANWAGRMADGMTYINAVSGFTQSVEFKQTYGDTTDAGFVTLLYNNVLDRAPDAAGLDNWSARLSSGAMSREQVVQGFAQSTEFVRATQPDLESWTRAQGRDDVLDGAGGQNVLMGGILSDTFVFRAVDEGAHVVVDAESWDSLRFEGFGYNEVAEVVPYLQSDGADVVFSDAAVTIRFLDTVLADLLDLEFLL